MIKSQRTSLVRGTYRNSKNGFVEIPLSIYIFKEDEYIIAYCPALDISGYGMNEEEANADFKAVLEEYFYYTTNKKTLKEDLQNLGWILLESDHVKMIAPTDEEIKKTNEDFNKILSTYPVKKINTSIQFPSLA